MGSPSLSRENSSRGGGSIKSVLPQREGAEDFSASSCCLRMVFTLSRQLNLYLPKFSIEGTYQLEKILPKLGIKDIFTIHADLSGITGYPNIKLSEVSLRCF